MRVYKLTNSENAISNLRNRRIKVSTIMDLNDPFELMGLQRTTREDRDIIKQEREEFANRFGVLCFSKSWGNPVLWSHYGEKHAGICLGFDVSDEKLRDIEYLKFMKSIDIGRYKDKFGAELMHKLIYMKFRDWAYEEEVHNPGQADQ